MSRAYEHSTIMSVLKRVDESIKDNYSSAQYMEVWDTLLYNAIEPILRCTNLVEVILSDVLHFYTENHRRKISVLSKEDVLTSFFLFLSAPKQKKLSRLKDIRLERSILKFIITTFLEKTQLYQKLMVSRCTRDKKITADRMAAIEASIGMNKNEDLFCTINTVKFWYEQSCTFKSQLLEKYYRLIVVEAQSFYANNNSNTRLDDILQNFVLFSSKALDKYDSSNGTLTSYIRDWFKHAKSVSLVNESGTAFILPSNKRSSVTNVAVSLDSEEVLQIEDENSVVDLDAIDTQRRVQLLAKIADPVGLGRLSFGISEILNKEEKLLQSKQTLRA